MEKQYKTQTITETISLEESHAVDAFGYTKALARAMQDTRNALLRKLIDDAPFIPVNSHEIEVKFNGQK